ncbi:MAG: TonB-dependent receptor [bacterium]|jgi:TonB-dependent receptor
MKQGILSLSLVILGLLSFGQNGTIRGTVTQQEDGQPVFEAFVKIVGSTNGTITDFDGQYAIEAIPGIYTLEITHLTFTTRTFTDITVLTGSVTVIDTKMGYGEANTLGTADLSLRRKRVEGDDAIISMVAKQKVVMSAIGKEQMTKQQATSAGDALKRVTGITVEGGRYVSIRGLGDRYSKTVLNSCEVPSLDPDRNSVQMDLFPSNIISNLQVFKTFMPELPGDFSGGLINITTKEFPDSLMFEFSSSLGGNSQSFMNRNFITYTGSATDFLGFDNGTRDMPTLARQADVPNVNPNPGADNSQLAALSKSFGTDNAVRTTTGGVNQSYSLSFGNQKKINSRPFGYLLGASYRRNFSFYDDGEIGRYNAVSSTDLNPQYDLQDVRSNDRVVTGLFGNFNYKINSTNKIGLNVMRNQSAEKITRVLTGRWAEDGPLSEDRIFNSQTLQFLQRTLTNIQLKGEHQIEDKSNKDLRVIWISSQTFSQQDEPDLRFFAYDYVVNGKDTNYAINKAAYNTPARYYRQMNELNWDNRAYLIVPLKRRFNKKAEFKTGFSYLYKNRKFRETRFDYSEVTDFNGDMNEFYSPENMSIERWPSEDPNSYTYIKGHPRGNDKNSYNGKQSVVAGFAQINTPFISKKWNFTGGLRVETTNVLVESLLATEEDGVLDNVDFLPSFNFTYNFIDKELVKDDPTSRRIGNLRFGFSQTLARPTFRELAPFSSFFFTGDYVLIGNPELKRTLIQNFDVRYELYPSRGQSFSVSGFYKKFHNPIEQTQNPKAANTEITYKNVGNANLYGVELEFVQNLSWVSYKLENFKWGLNGSLIKSQVKVDSLEYAVRKEIDNNASETRPMYSQSPYIFNTYLNFENDSNTFSANVSFNIFGKRLALVSQGDLPDVYEMPRPSLDVNLFKSIGPKFQLTASVKNILNPRVRLIHEYAGQEYIYSGNNAGISWSFGLKYKI